MNELQNVVTHFSRLSDNVTFQPLKYAHNAQLFLQLPTMSVRVRRNSVA